MKTIPPLLSCLRATLLSAAVACFGCSSPSRTIEIKATTATDLPQTVEQSGIEIREAIAIAIKATALEDGSPLEADPEVVLTSSNPSVLGVGKSLTKNQFVLFGVAEGKASISATVEGKHLSDTPAAVVTQQALDNGS